MKHTEETTEKRNYFTCDKCGERQPEYRTTQCDGCHCDICPSCRVVWWADPWIGGDCGDYPSHYCKTCDALAKPFVAKARPIREKAEEQIATLINRWQEECKTNRRKVGE